MGNALVATRLSRSTDASTSVERQAESGRKCAEMRGDTVIAVTEDVDVSGSVSPFDRDDLGPWLTDADKISQWDVIIIAKLDRLTRNLRDFDDFRLWCDAHGKTVVSVAESLDLSTPVGRMFANLLAMFAQFERERIAERAAEGQRKLKSGGHWGGGTTPFGFVAVESGNHWVLAVDDDQAAVIRDAAAKIVSGWSMRRTAKACGISPRTLAEILRRENLRGVVTHNGQVVRDESGMPVRHAAILSDDEWLALQAKLDESARPGHGGHKDAAMLIGVARCGCCDAPIYINRRLVRGKPAPNYRHADSQCANGGQGAFSAGILETAVESALLGKIGDVERTETRVIPGENHDAEIARVEASIDDIEASVMDGMPASSAGRMLAKLEERLTKLRALPRTADETVERPTGQTYRQHWTEMDTEARGVFLRDNGIKVYAAKDTLAVAARGGLADADQSGDDVPRVVTMTVKGIHVAVSFGSLSHLIDSAKAA